MLLSHSIGVECGNLPNPTNGRVSLTGTTFGSIATYRCNSGFELVGEKTQECLEDGKWSGDDPTCERKLKEIPILDSGMYTNNC